MENKKSKKQQIKIELDEKTSQGNYSNFVIVTHSPAEFVLDFTRILPGTMKSKVQSRIIMTPSHTKSLLMTLQNNIKQYESEYGEVKVNIQDELPIDIESPPDKLPN